MAYVINENKAVAMLDRYFSALAETGYVKSSTLCRFLLYLFLIDFTDCVYPYMTEEDYAKVRRLLSHIFSGGDCLLPYPMDCDKSAVLGGIATRAKRVRKINNTGEDVLRKTDGENMRRI